VRRVVATAADHRDAQLTILKGRLSERFTTRNVAVPPFDSDAPRRWTVSAPGWSVAFYGSRRRRLQGGTELDFEMAKSLIDKTLGGLFAHATGTMVDAFLFARAVYGVAA
jgi:ribosome-associated toxin RatA of RatAB toxin-antitoxin module